jgi:hypothetical protein
VFGIDRMAACADAKRSDDTKADTAMEIIAPRNPAPAIYHPRVRTACYSHGRYYELISGETHDGRSVTAEIARPVSNCWLPLGQ